MHALVISWASLLDKVSSWIQISAEPVETSSKIGKTKYLCGFEGIEKSEG